MPSSMSHVVVFATDLDEVLTFLAEHARLGPVSRYEVAASQMSDLFGWPPADTDARGAFVGNGPGSLEIVEIPPSIQDRVAPGLAILAVPNRDAAAAAGALRAAGIEAEGPNVLVTPGGVTMSVVTATVGGLPFELVEFAKAGA